MAYENLQEKYGLTAAQMKQGVDAVASGLGSICNVTIMLAIAELLANGDIKEEK